MKLIPSLFKQTYFQIIVAFLFAIAMNHLNIGLGLATMISHLFVSGFKILALPIVFLSIISTITGINNTKDLKALNKKVIFYSLLTTVIAAIVALILYKVINPAYGSTSYNNLNTNGINDQIHLQKVQFTYIDYFLSIIPENFFKIFLDNNIIGCIIIAFLISYAINKLEPAKNVLLHNLFSSFFDTLLIVARFILRFLPIAIFGFVRVFLDSLKNYSHALDSIILFLLCVVIANLVQGFIVLPLFLKFKGISPMKTFKAVLPALTLAFFSKSSSATLPTTLSNVQNNLKVSKKLSSFTLPMCTTINMNACAAFIFICITFVSEQNGYHFSYLETGMWLIVAVIGAFGNAGVPMGCYFIATSYLTSLRMPLELMGVILPAYVILDMLETSLNVWSDICITQVINKEYPMED